MAERPRSQARRVSQLQ